MNRPVTAGTWHPVALFHGHARRDIFIAVGLLLVAAAFLYIQKADLAKTWQILTAVPPGLLMLGAALLAGTYFLAAISYTALAGSRRVRLLPTLAVQTASGFTNRLLPAGLGGAGLYAYYFKKRGFNYAQSTALVAANGIMGVTGNAILLTAVIVATPGPARLLDSGRLPMGLPLLIGGVCVICILLVLLRGRWIVRLKAFLSQAIRSLKSDLRPGPRTGISLLSNVSLTSINCLILCLAVAAAGGSLYWPLSIIVLSVGTAVGAAVPTPGGLGGAEAGILAGLVACGVPAAPALAATLIYRGLTYWLPILPGLSVLPWVRRHYL